MSRRDGAIVAWHEVPGTVSPQMSRPVGYGVIRTGVRTDSMIGVAKFRMRKLKKFRLFLAYRVRPSRLSREHRNRLCRRQLSGGAS